jgi:2-hydroxychromene-2-carboxylate isomerase
VSAEPPVFYFGAMSPYSWLAAERIGELLPQARWQPLFLGGLFKAVGRHSWGLDEQREEQMRECEQRAVSYGLGAISWPEPWPTNDLYVARGMTFAATRGLLEQFALAAMRAAFLQGTDLGSPEAVLQVGGQLEIAPAELEAALADPAIKEELRAATEDAHTLGIIGVPTVAVEGQLFWGDDRLEEAAQSAGGEDGAGGLQPAPAGG